MVFIIFFGVIGLISAIAVLVDEMDKRYGDVGFGVFALFLFTTIGAGLGAIIALLIGLGDGDKGYSTFVTTPLVSLNDHIGGRGQFYLFGGSINSAPGYAWYEETSPNSYQLKSVPADEAVIHYILDDSQPRYVTVTKHDCDRGKSSLRTWSIFSCDSDVDHYDFYVPKGSITHEYRLDAQ